MVKIYIYNEMKEGLVLLHHIDVVPANEKYWSFGCCGGGA